MEFDLSKLIELTNQYTDLNLNNYNKDFLVKIITKHQAELRIMNFELYLIHLKRNKAEIERLIQYVFISYTRFFRNSLTYEILECVVLLEIIRRKSLNNNSLRLWSAGCATGEEAYSIAIIVNEIFKRLSVKIPVHLIATDIDKKSLELALVGKYKDYSIKSVKHHILKEYFLQEKDTFSIMKTIKDVVTFAHYDLTDMQSFAPSESIYGNYDLILCRNVLIYMNQEYQNRIISKLYKALEKDGYLILGKSEYMPEQFKHYFEKVIRFCPIYRKIG